jgi:hypothetical protein
MTRYGHIGWRVAAVVVAFAGTAALAVILTRAPESSQAAPSPNASCPATGLRAWLGLGRGGTQDTGTSSTGAPLAGGTYYTLEFTNVSRQACSLYGYPEVSAYTTSQTAASQLGGHSPAGQLGSAAIRDTSVRPQQVRLEPGETAHSLLRVTETGTSQPAACLRVTARELRVTLPHQGRSAFVPVHIPICARKGHVSLSVEAIQSRSAISGYTMP